MRNTPQAFQRALRLNPLHLDSYHRMALTQFNMGEVFLGRAQEGHWGYLAVNL